MHQITNKSPSGPCVSLGWFLHWHSLPTVYFAVKHKYFFLLRRDRLNMQLYGGQTRVHTYTHTQRPMGVRVCSVWWDLEVCAAVSLITAYMIVISDSDYCHGIEPQVTDLFNVIPEGHTLTQTLTNKNTHTYAGTVWKAVPVRVEVRTVSEVWPCRLKCFSVFSLLSLWSKVTMETVWHDIFKKTELHLQ